MSSFIIINLKEKGRWPNQEILKKKPRKNLPKHSKKSVKQKKARNDTVFSRREPFLRLTNGKN